MNWNDGYERKMFEKKNENQNKEYKTLGMTDEQIQAINEFDYERYKAERIYNLHTQPLDINVFLESDCDESDNALLKKFGDQISTSLEDGEGFSRYWWIEQLDTPELAEAIKVLPEKDIELLTMMAFDNMSQQEIAGYFGVNRVTVATWTSKIRKKLSNYIKILKTTTKRPFSLPTY